MPNAKFSFDILKSFHIVQGIGRFDNSSRTGDRPGLLVEDSQQGSRENKVIVY